MKKLKLLYYIGTTLSMLVGVWHFFVPYMFQWYSYIPAEYEALIVGIDYTNFCFSLLLTGLSLILIIFGKKFFNKNKEVFVFYGFLVFVWFSRIVLSFVEPWPFDSSNPLAWTAYAQQIGAILIFVMLIIPFVCLLYKGKKTGNE